MFLYDFHYIIRQKIARSEEVVLLVAVWCLNRFSDFIVLVCVWVSEWVSEWVSTDEAKVALLETCRSNKYSIRNGPTMLSRTWKLPPYEFQTLHSLTILSCTCSRVVWSDLTSGPPTTMAECTRNPGANFGVVRWDWGLVSLRSQNRGHYGSCKHHRL